MMVLRIFGAALASSFAFLVCMLLGSEVSALAPPGSNVGGWLVPLVSAAVAGAFGFAFWKWPAAKRKAETSSN
jgi:hypothetical protein